MEAKITKDGLTIGGRLILPTAKSLDAALGTFDREIQIPLHDGGVRRRRVFDELGLAYYLDDAPPEVPSVLFLFYPDDAPFKVEHAFGGSLRINNALLTSDLTESKFEREGSLQFEPQFGHKLRATEPKFSVWLSFRRRPNRFRQRAGVPKLTDVSICYEGMSR